ncbi:nucleolar transcription factor 1 isoform X1 [Brassica napus]|uniref:nucleolar transcription factor 1 isoform X1 n=1 Tax=Brassica napus TaxID=3708 RepID=UPI0006AB17CF|nr:nucleolar transcription factor 1 isoform X1 [Brassica napus]XP_048617022.1 nucleolar transcription factor 1 isoform X1 [Brassica napus]
MAQEDYNLDMNTESVQLAYLLPEAMMQQMTPDTPPIHVTSDRQVQNLLEIAKMHEVRLCVSSLSKMIAVSEEGEEDDEWDEADEGNKADEVNEDDDDMAEDEKHDGEGDDGDEDADIPIVAEAVDDAEDYSEYEKVKDEDEDEEEDDDMCFEDFKGTYGSEGGRSYGSKIYVNQSFASKDALVSELRLTAVRRKFSFRIYKSMKTLLVATCRVNGCG